MKFRKGVAIVLCTALAWAGFAGSAGAAIVSTGEAQMLDAHQGRVVAVQAALARDNVQQAMVALGVDPVAAQQRVASLSAQELTQLEGQLETLPAGGILGLIGAVFVVLLVLELTGVIDIFKKV
jgi:hypothetical protein